MSAIHQTLYFIVTTLFDLYLFALLLRFLFQWVRADFYNPISQLVVKLTNPPLKPLRRIIPGLWGLDMACLVACLLFCGLKLTSSFWLQFYRFPDFVGLCVWSMGDLTKTTIHLFFYAIMMQALLSWISPHGNNPMQPVLAQLTTPVMRPIRRFMPQLGGFDITPVFAMLFLQVITILIATPIVQVGLKMALS